MSGVGKLSKKKLVLVILAELSFFVLVALMNIGIRYLMNDVQIRTQDTETIKELQIIDQNIKNDYNQYKLSKNSLSSFNPESYKSYNTDAKEIQVRIYYKADNNMLEIEKNDYYLKVLMDKENNYISSEIIDNRPFTSLIEEHLISVLVSMIIGLFYITFVRLRLSKIPSRITKEN